jgi:hypothetical protein
MNEKYIPRCFSSGTKMLEIQNPIVVFFLKTNDLSHYCQHHGIFSISPFGRESGVEGGGGCH